MAAIMRCCAGRLGAASVARRFSSSAASAQMALNKHPQVAQAVVTEQPGGSLQVSVLPVSRIKQGPAMFGPFRLPAFLGGTRTALQPVKLGKEDIEALLTNKVGATIEIVASEDELPVSSHDRVVLLDLLKTLFDQADSNSDGAISLSEFKEFTKSLGLDREEHNYQELFMDYDANMKYELSFKEFKAMLLGTKLIAVEDVSGDGVAAEFRVDAALLDLVVRHIFAKADLDADGKISSEEVATLLTVYNIDAVAADAFGKVDKDGDGKIGQKELTELLLNVGVVGKRD